MATITLGTEIAIMFVVLVMAAAARSGYFNFVPHRAQMALVAIRNIFVRAGQFEVGLIMVEVPRLPTARVMTLLTLRTQTPLVYLFVIFLMA